MRDPLFEWGAGLEKPSWRKDNVDSSALAAESISRGAQLEIAWEVMCRWVRSMPEGLTDDQYAEERGEVELYSTYRKRRSELKNIHWLTKPPKEFWRKTRAGRLAVPWVVTQEGGAYYERGKAIFMAAYRRMKKEFEELQKKKKAGKGVVVQLENI